MDAPVERTRIRRLPDKAVRDRGALHEVLDAGTVGHVAFVHGPPWSTRRHAERRAAEFLVEKLR